MEAVFAVNVNAPERVGEPTLEVSVPARLTFWARLAWASSVPAAATVIVPLPEPRSPLAATVSVPVVTVVLPWKLFAAFVRSSVPVPAMMTLPPTKCWNTSPAPESRTFR